MVHALRDGTRVLLRPIEPADKDRLTVALGRLSQETIRRRFLAAKPRFSSGELRYLTEVDGHDHLALVAVLADDPDDRRVARCVASLTFRRPPSSQSSWAIPSSVAASGR